MIHIRSSRASSMRILHRHKVLKKKRSSKIQTLLLTHLMLARRRSPSLKRMVVSISSDVTDFLITASHNSLVPLSKVELNLIISLVRGGIVLACERLHFQIKNKRRGIFKIFTLAQNQKAGRSINITFISTFRSLCSVNLITLTRGCTIYN